MGSEAVLFRRYEKKFLIDEDCFDRLIRRLNDYMVPDKYAYSNITNIYYDTPSFALIRASIDKPFYKEKLRVRSYGIPTENDKVFVEIKKKFDGVVYKRRIPMTLRQAEAYLSGEAAAPNPCQISREIDYFKQFYTGLAPAMYISYERYSLASPDGGPLRITFDRKITWRREDLHLAKGVYGNSLLEPGQVLMEIKVPGVYPLWLARLLDEFGIRQTSYSKYGKIFESALQTGLIRLY